MACVQLTIQAPTVPPPVPPVPPVPPSDGSNSGTGSFIIFGGFIALLLGMMRD